MPSWGQILVELQTASKTDPNCIDTTRRKYLAQLTARTGRNTIAYYSGWLRQPNQRGIEISDDDKNGFLTVHHCFMPTFANTPAIKIIENHTGAAIVNLALQSTSTQK